MTAPTRRKWGVDELWFATIDLEQGHGPLPECTDLPETEYRESFYANPKGPLSIAQLPDTGDGYRAMCSQVARSNANWAWRLGYRHQLIDRADYEDDLYELRSSSPERQGRAMPDAYMERQAYGRDEPPRCPHHGYTVHGIVDDGGKLVAYAQMMRCGQIVRVNTILGHHDYLEDRVVWLLFMEMIPWHVKRGARFALYYTHGSGVDGGLQYFKERLGFKPTEATWVFA